MRCLRRDACFPSDIHGFYATASRADWLGSGISKVFLSVALLVGVALPATADVPPTPQSRPTLERLEVSSVDASASKAEPAKLAARLRVLSKVLARAGLDLDRLVNDAPAGQQRFSEGQGGPLVGRRNKRRQGSGANCRSRARPPAPDAERPAGGASGLALDGVRGQQRLRLPP